MTENNVIPIVKVKKNTGTLYALSTDVSNFFEREHKKVLDSIEKCLSDQADLARHFRRTKYSIKGHSYNRYEMSRTA